MCSIDNCAAASRERDIYRTTGPNGGHFVFQSLWTRYPKNRSAESLVILYVDTYLSGREMKKVFVAVKCFSKKWQLFLFFQPLWTRWLKLPA